MWTTGNWSILSILHIMVTLLVTGSHKVRIVVVSM